MSPSRPIESEDPAYSTIEKIGVNLNPIRKTISDTNALFLFNESERKKSAPETPVFQIKQQQNGLERISVLIKMILGTIAKSCEKIIEGHKINKEEEIRIHHPNEPFEQLFNGKKESKEHPAMEIFKMPQEMNEKTTVEIERRARERDRSARGRKQRRNFFEQIRARLSGNLN